MYERMNVENLKTAIIMEGQAELLQLASVLGPILNAIQVYESVKTRPRQIEIAEAKMEGARKRSKAVVGIISRWQRETGVKILNHYIGEDERLELVMDLDDFFNEIFARKVSD